MSYHFNSFRVCICASPSCCACRNTTICSKSLKNRTQYAVNLSDCFPINVRVQLWRLSVPQSNFMYSKHTYSGLRFHGSAGQMAAVELQAGCVCHHSPAPENAFKKLNKPATGVARMGCEECGQCLLDSNGFSFF